MSRERKRRERAHQGKHSQDQQREEHTAGNLEMYFEPPWTQQRWIEQFRPVCDAHLQQAGSERQSESERQRGRVRGRVSKERERQTERVRLADRLAERQRE